MKKEIKYKKTEHKPFNEAIGKKITKIGTHQSNAWLYITLEDGSELVVQTVVDQSKVGSKDLFLGAGCFAYTQSENKKNSTGNNAVTWHF